MFFARRAYTKTLPCYFARPVGLNGELYLICKKDGKWKALRELGNSWEEMDFAGVDYVKGKIIEEGTPRLIYDIETVEFDDVETLAELPFSPFGYWDFGIAKVKKDDDWESIAAPFTFDYLQIGNGYVFVKKGSRIAVVSFNPNIATFEAVEAPHHDVVVGWDMKGVTFVENMPREFYIISLFRYGIAGPFGIVKTTEGRQWQKPNVWVEGNKAVIWNKQTPILKRHIITIADISIKHATVDPRRW